MTLDYTKTYRSQDAVVKGHFFLPEKTILLRLSDVNVWHFLRSVWSKVLSCIFPFPMVKYQNKERFGKEGAE